MDATSTPADSTAPVALVCGDPGLTAGFLAAAAAAGVRVQQVTRAEELPGAWASASQVYLGLDVVESVHASGLARRSGLHLLVRAGAEAVGRWSCAFDACVVALPDPDGVLMSRLASSAGLVGGELVVLSGASGGVGVSTLTLALARKVAGSGRSVLVVDLDPDGGGIDLAAGAERVAGWRWDALTGASGQVGDLTAELPEVDGVHLLAMPRDGGSEPGPVAVAAVLASARRSFDTCLVDSSRSGSATLTEALSSATRCWLMVRGEAPSVAAARSRLPRLGRGAPPVELLAQIGAAGGIGVTAVERALGTPVLATLPDDPRLRAGVARGEPAPGRGSRRWRRAVGLLAAEVLA